MVTFMNAVNVSAEIDARIQIMVNMHQVNEERVHNLYWRGTLLKLYGATSISTGFIPVAHGVISMP